MLRNGDISDSNAASMALWAIGIDAEICEQLAGVLEQKRAAESSRSQIVGMLGKVKPPSERTLRALTVALADPSPWVESQAAETVGQLGVSNRTLVSALKGLQSTSTNELVVVNASAALWELERDPKTTLGPIIRVLTNALARPVVGPFGQGNGGQGVSADEQLFMAAGELFQRMNLAKSDKAGALALLDASCEKSQRIFIRMLLLPAMMELGFPHEKCLEVCRTGLSQEEIYYRLQAARLLLMVTAKYGTSGLALDPLIHDREVGVRVYAAIIHWHLKKQPEVVVPILTDALNRVKHQSYYYDIEILPAALHLLKELGPDAAPATAELTALTHDPNPAVSKLATDALAGIRK